MAASDVQEAFLEALPESLRQDATPALLARVTALVALGREAWPAVGTSATGFARCVAAQVVPGPEPFAVIERLQAADLFLAWSCLQGDAPAIRQLEQSCLPAVDTALARLGLPQDLADEAKQRLRLHLLMEATGPALAKYGGRGRLTNWLRLTAVRIARRLLQNEERLRTRERASPLAMAEDEDIHRGLVRRDVGEHVQAALDQAIARLPAAERLLLKRYYVDGFTLEEIGVLEGAHRATVCRRLAAARAMVLDETCTIVKNQLRLSDSSVVSLLHEVQSALDVDLATTLRQTA